MPIIRYYGSLRDLTGLREERIRGDWLLKDLLEELLKRHSKLEHYLARDSLIILHNGKGLSDKELPERRVNEDDLIELMPPASGG